VHFRTELSCEKDLNDEYRAIIESLDQLYQDVGRQISDLEKALQQIDKYQHDVQLLKQKLVQEEQLLKTMTLEHPDSSDPNIQVGVFVLKNLITLYTPPLTSYY
jgi:oligoendopeptidase F